MSKKAARLRQQVEGLLDRSRKLKAETRNVLERMKAVAVQLQPGHDGSSHDTAATARPVRKPKPARRSRRARS